MVLSKSREIHGGGTAPNLSRTATERAGEVSGRFQTVKSRLERLTVHMLKLYWV